MLKNGEYKPKFESGDIAIYVNLMLTTPQKGLLIRIPMNNKL